MLSAVPCFAGLNATTLEAVARSAIRRSYEPEQVVFLEGDPCAGLYVVQDGWLKSVKVSLEGREQVIRVVGPGETFNEIGVFAGTPNHATIVALEPATVWVIPRETLLQLMDEYPSLARMIAQNLAQRVLHLLDLVEDLSLRTTEARLARYLLEESGGEVLHRRRWTTQAEIASQLGTVLDVLNRALRSLSEEGLIRVERHQIQILDRQGLEAKALLSE
jgi:CRP/FNR family transcriptional regulator